MLEHRSALLHGARQVSSGPLAGLRRRQGVEGAAITRAICVSRNLRLAWAVGRAANPTTLAGARRLLTLIQEKDDSEALVVRVDAGVSDTKVRRFRAASPAQTITVGAQGAWKVEAAGVASVHAYLRFDGHRLLVATSDPSRPVVVDGQPAPETWLPLEPPCVLTLGRASLSVERDGAPAHRSDPQGGFSASLIEPEEEPTCRKSSPVAAPARRDKAPPEATSDVDLPPAEPTRLQFGHVDAPPPAGTRPIQVSSLPPTLLEPTVPAGEEAFRSMGSTPPTPMPAERRHRIRRAVQAGGLGLGLALLVVGIQRLASPRTGAPASPSHSAAGPHVEVVPPAAPRASASLGATASPPAAPQVWARPPELGAPSSTPGTRNQATLERRAADAFAAGDFPTALRLYRELAAARPDQPAFRQAVRILEEK
jgi:hypothetical protein